MTHMGAAMTEHAFGIAAYSAGGLQPSGGTEARWPPPGEAGAGLFNNAAVPVSLRRRVTPIGQAALRHAWALPQVEQARFVFASRNGEFDRTLTMLTQMAEGEPPSPADFSLGVHNALAGLLSVATHNRNGHTALAAGIDSFGFGLLEAVAGLHEAPEHKTILVYFDTPLPQDYPCGSPVMAADALALALLLVPQI